MFTCEQLLAYLESGKSADWSFVFEARDPYDFDNRSSEESLCVAQFVTTKPDSALAFWVEFMRKCASTYQSYEGESSTWDARAIAEGYLFESISECDFASAFRNYASGTIRHPISVRFPKERERFREGMKMQADADIVAYIARFDDSIIAFEWITTA